MQTVLTDNPILNERRMVRVLTLETGRPYVRPLGTDPIGAQHHYLTGFDSLGCLVWAPCDVNGIPVVGFDNARNAV